MNVETGKVYQPHQLNFALEEADDPEDVVQVIGTENAVNKVADAVKAQRRAANKRARQSRKRNRS